MPRWPLALIAPAAAVAIWSGWVGLGELCGFGPVHVLPGIAPRFVINTAICLPVGMEAYAGFALGVWLRNSGVPAAAKDFARWSAFGALALGVLGQVAFHVLSSLHVRHAPIWVVVFVSCIPVGVLGLAAALAHLMSGTPEDEAKPEPERVPVGVPVKPPLPSVREVRDDHRCGPATEKKIRRALRARDAQWAQAFERGRGGSPARVPVAAPAAVPPATVGALNGRAAGE